MLSLLLLACTDLVGSSVPSSLSAGAAVPAGGGVPVDEVVPVPINPMDDFEDRLNLERGYRELELGLDLYRQGREVLESGRDRLRDLALLANEAGLTADDRTRAELAARFSVGWGEFLAMQSAGRMDGVPFAGGALTRELPNGLRVATIFTIQVPDLRSVTLGLPVDGPVLHTPVRAREAQVALDAGADRLDAQLGSLISGEDRLMAMYTALVEANGRIEGMCPTSLVLSAAHVRATVGAHVAKRAGEGGAMVDFGLVALERYAGVLADPETDPAYRSQLIASWTATVEVLRDVVDETRFDQESVVSGQRAVWSARLPSAVEALGMPGMDVPLPDWTVGQLGLDDLDLSTPESAAAAADHLAGVRRQLVEDRASLEEAVGRLELTRSRVDGACWR